MNNKNHKGWIAVAVVLMLLLVDQLSKIWVKTHMALYDAIQITDWFQIYFVENNGMAFGIEAGGKLFLSLFRIVAVILIIIYIGRLVRENYKTGFIVCITLVLAGAAGNIVDSVLYGVIFEASYPGHGKVVDMLYFPLISGHYPDWIPVVGGQEFLFFRFIFNLADSAITIGVILILLFYRKTLSYSLMSKSERDKLDTEAQDKNSRGEI